MTNPLTGSLVALPTPFREGRLDLSAFQALVETHRAAKTRGLVVCGTTGEACTLTDAEKQTLIASAVRFAGDLPVVVGVGSNRTDSTVKMACYAEASGAAAALVVTPYYNKPNPSGLHRHFGAVDAAIDLPVLLYNVPSRTGLDLEPALVRELFERHACVRGIKEVTDSRERVRKLRAIDGLALYCGEDSALRLFAREGAHGAIGVLANVAPDEVAELLEAGAADECLAAALEAKLAPLLEALYLETNPVPVKAALARLGRMTSEVRSPLGPLSPENEERLGALLVRFAAPATAAAPGIRD